MDSQLTTRTTHASAALLCEASTRKSGSIWSARFAAQNAAITSPSSLASLAAVSEDLGRLRTPLCRTAADMSH